MDQILEDKVAIITGGSSGMGRAGVELFAEVCMFLEIKSPYI